MKAGRYRFPFCWPCRSGHLGPYCFYGFNPSLDDNIYAQIGLITLIGLAAKNAILIVEFAKERVDRGMELEKATLEAVRLRLRPIIMTSMAFILGVLPLLVATGAGAQAQANHRLDCFWRDACGYIAGYIYCTGAVLSDHQVAYGKRNLPNCKKIISLIRTMMRKYK